MKTLYGDIPAIPDTPQMQAAMEPRPKDIRALAVRELLFFKIAGKIEGYDGPGRFYHARKASDLIWRNRKGQEAFTWHPWMEDSLEEYCKTDEVLITGPASAGKTNAAALFANLFWRCSPEDTGIIVCSTTRDGLKKRIWSEIRKYYLASQSLMGGQSRLIDSDLCILSSKGATKEGIFGIAVAAGEEQKAMGRIIGFHPRRIMVIVDELSDVSWAIIDALTNLFTAKQKAQFAGISNASLIFDSHGKMCEPEQGWNSVTVESIRWETKRGGVALHFDGFKCENVLKSEKIYPFLLTQEDIDKTTREHGANSPQMWRMRRGFWCPEGTTKTVLNDAIIRKFLTMEKAVWRDSTTVWAGLDPAFEGGDRCVLRFGKIGKSTGDIDTLELGDIVTIKTDVTKTKDPLHFQIARQVKEECEKREVDPKHFGMDVTGEGGGLASIIANEWGHGFHQVEFGGRPSDLPVSEINSKLCSKEYKNKVTELWYSFRQLVTSGQVRGLDAETAVEFCNRLYTVDEKTWVEPKLNMKARPGGRSPDNADAVCVLADTIRHRGDLGISPSKVHAAQSTEWASMVKEFELEEEAFAYDGIENL